MGRKSVYAGAGMYSRYAAPVGSGAPPRGRYAFVLQRFVAERAAPHALL